MDKIALYQSFDDLSDASNCAPRLAALRAAWKRRGLDGFLIPRADEHQGEYVPKRAERLGWLTGFTGSARFACVLMDKGGIFVACPFTLYGRQNDRPQAFPDARPARRDADELDRGESARGGKARLRPVAAYASRRRTVANVGR